MNYLHEETLETNIGKIWFTVSEVGHSFGDPMQGRGYTEVRMILPAAYSICGKALHSYHRIHKEEYSEGYLEWVRQHLLKTIGEVAVSPYEEDGVKWGILCYGCLMVDAYDSVVTFDTEEEASEYAQGNEVVRIKPNLVIKHDGWSLVE